MNKKDVLHKFYGGDRKSWMHKFRINDGICANCGNFIGDVNSKMCPVITKDEVKSFDLEGLK